MPKTLVRKGPIHGALHRTGVKKPFELERMPRWQGWRYTSEAARIKRWCEHVVVLPTGKGAGLPMRVHRFQRQLLDTITESLATFISIPAGNGKTTFMAAVGLERLARGDNYVEVDVLATKEDQAQRVLEACIQIIESSPGLPELFEFWAQSGTLEYRPTGSIMRAHSARLSAVQGLNYSLALVDEVGFVPASLVTALLARLGKRDDARLVGFGTPGAADSDNMLELLRSQHHTGELPAGVSFVEYAGEPGCDVNDREQWRKANPALGAGFLREQALAVQAATMPEHEFRAYHLGQPLDASGPWLPYGAWDDCVQSDVPRDGTPVVLAMWGTYSREVALVGATLDGALFFGWQAAKPTDAQVAEAIVAASEQWDLQELTHKPHIRLALMQQLADQGLPVRAWPGDRGTDVESSAAFYQAIAEQTVAHEHDPTLGEQVARLTARIDSQGNPRLVESEGLSAALAARAAWWRAKAVAEAEPTDSLVIY